MSEQQQRTIKFDPSKMEEAEVSLRLALSLCARPEVDSPVTVCLDSYHARNDLFPVSDFLEQAAWTLQERNGNEIWQGTYQKDGRSLILSPHSTLGDVVASVDGKCLRVESKRGWREKLKRQRNENKTCHEAIGQLMTTQVSDSDLLFVALPDFPELRKKMLEWQNRPLMKRAGIGFLFVGRDGSVDGLPF